MPTLRIDGTDRQRGLDSAMPLRGALRDRLQLTGAPYGGGMAQAAVALGIAWLEPDGVEGGSSQSGQVLAATVQLAETPAPRDGENDSALAGSLSRCVTDGGIRPAIRQAARTLLRGAPS